MRGKRVKQLRESVRQAQILIGDRDGATFTLRQTKRNHQGGRKTFTRSATATGYFCSRKDGGQ